jgi:hypothetical protein
MQLSWQANADAKCPPLPPPADSNCDDIWARLHVAAHSKDERARYAINRITAASSSIAANGEVEAMSRDEYCMAQASHLGRVQYRRSAAAPTYPNAGASHRTIFQKFVEMQIYSQYVFVLRRIDPITSAIAAKKEKQMGGFSSEQSRQWQKGECAYNRLVYAEQMGWSSLAPWPTPWVALPGPSSGSSKPALSSSASLLMPVPGCVPGFVPPPGWRLSYEQFSGLQSHGVIPENQAWNGVMPMLRKHDTASGYQNPDLGAARGVAGGMGPSFQDERLSFLHIPADGERTTQASSSGIINSGNRASNRTYSHGDMVQNASMRYPAHAFSPRQPLHHALNPASLSNAQSPSTIDAGATKHNPGMQPFKITAAKGPSTRNHE